MIMIYYSLLIWFYRIIKLGRKEDLYYAIGSSILLAFSFTIGLHVTIGTIFGRSVLIKYHSILLGNIILFSFTLFNILLFVRKKKYIELDKEFTLNRNKYLGSLSVFLIYFLWMIFTFINVLK
jgi:hypothetical protein